MKIIGAILVTGVLIASATTAFAQSRQRDFSLPMNESLRQRDTQTTPSPLNTTNQSGGMYGSPQGTQQPSITYNDRYGRGGMSTDDRDSSNHFMDMYCDPNSAPTLVNRAMQACVEAKKREACDAFNRQPRDVKKALNEAIDCKYAASESGDDRTSDDCAETSERRLRLMRKYAREQEVMNALAFLPEDVIEGSSSCVTGRQ